MRQKPAKWLIILLYNPDFLYFQVHSQSERSLKPKKQISVLMYHWTNLYTHRQYGKLLGRHVARTSASGSGVAAWWLRLAPAQRARHQWTDGGWKRLFECFLCILRIGFRYRFPQFLLFSFYCLHYNHYNIVGKWHFKIGIVYLH